MTGGQKWAALIIGAAIILPTLWILASTYVDELVNRAALAIQLDLATTNDDFAEYADPDPYDWSAPTLHAWADPFANTRAEIAALETTEERL